MSDDYKDKIFKYGFQASTCVNGSLVVSISMGPGVLPETIGFSRASDLIDFLICHNPDEPKIVHSHMPIENTRPSTRIIRKK